MRAVYILPALCAAASTLFGAAAHPSAEAFAARALPALPVEEPYTFQKILAGGVELLRRAPAARPAASELAIGGQGWRLVIRRDSGPLLRHAAAQFRDRMEGMRVKLSLETADSLDGAQRAGRAVVAGTREQMPACASGLAGPKDYRILVSGESIAVCGYDERGAMYGLYNLEARFSLREAPFLPRNLDTTRRSLFRTRMTLSGLGWMNWPDNLLATAARYGFDAVHDSVYRNPNNAPGPPPYWDRIKTHPPGAMQDLVRRAARQGLGVYVPILWRFTRDPENEAGLRKLVRDIVTEFPGIRGYVLLTEGFFYERWFGAGAHGNQDLRQWIREWVRGVAIVAEECHKINPAIEVLPWEYNVDFRPQHAETKAYGTAQLPPDTIPLLTFENGKSFVLDGETGTLKDYAITVPGPAEVTEAQIREAKRLGRTVYSKADTWGSWQFGTFPYLPFPYQWHRRYEALEKWGVEGTLESWSCGFKPNFVAEMRAWYSWTGAPPLDELLRAVARRDFGAGSEDLVLEAWKRFSQAIRLVPDTAPDWGTNNAVGTPLFLKRPGPRMETRNHSWHDPALFKRATNGIVEEWPYVTERLILWPDFTNRVNVAERYAHPFSLPVFMKYVRLAAEEMEAGLGPYRRAALAAPAAKRAGAYREVLLAEQLQRMLRSEHAVLEFEDLRFRLASAAPAAHPAMLRRLGAILREEIVRTKASLAAAERDSRLGFEWEQDYVYTPFTLREKIEVLEHTLTAELPALGQPGK